MAKQEVWTPDQFREHAKKNGNKNGMAEKLKFRNQPQTIDGIYFPSKWEAEYYGQCKLRVKAGNLAKFEVHVKFPLMVNGELICTYEADFVLYFPDGSFQVVDTKSEATEGLSTFKIKKKLMWAIHKIKVVVVKK